MDSAEIRFWQYVDRGHPGGCWVWTGNKNRLGYGRFGISYKVYLAHRLALQWHLEEDISGKIVDHECHNPPCVNPAHLRVCTRGQNSMNSGRRKDNKSGLKGVCKTKNGKWAAHISYLGHNICIGSTFITPEEAHEAYVYLAKKLFGEYARVY